MFISAACKLSRLVLIILTISMIPHGVFAANSTSPLVRSGIGYDYFSQKYFLDSLVATDSDTTIQSWEYSRRYLNDLKLWLSVDIPLAQENRNQLHFLGEVSDELWRFRLSPVFSANLGENRLSGGLEIERKDRHRGTPESGDSYWFGLARTRFHVPIAPKVRTFAGLIADAARFDSSTTSALDYRRVAGSAGLEFSFGLLSTATLEFFGVRRTVPDSSWLGYQSLGSEASLYWSPEWCDVGMIARIEDFRFDDPDHVSDHTRIDGNLKWKSFLSRTWYLLADSDGESALYDADNFLNQSVWRARTAWLIGRSFGKSMSLALGPHFERLDEEPGLVTINADYEETGARIDADILAGNNLFGTLQSITGKRNVLTETETQGDFTFQRLTVIGDGRIIGKLGLSVFWSLEWEWHERDSDNNFSHFISGSLSQSF